MATNPGLKAGMSSRHAPVWLAMAAMAAMSWLYLVQMQASMSAMDTNGPAASALAMADGGATPLLMVFAMWAVMMVAMMLPSVAPSAWLFSGLSARRNPANSKRATSLYVAGYTTSWIAFAAPAAVLQWMLTSSGLIDGMGRSTASWLSAAILLGAGLYQFSALKTACLSKCRSPLAFFMAQWRDGAAGALRLGLGHGGICVACCWALMAVMFVVGAMNLVWMGLFTLVVLGEKLMPPAWRFDRIVGMTLIASGLWIGVGAALSG